MTDETLFDVAEPPVTMPAPKPLKKPAKWSSVNTLGKCDHCMRALVEHEGHAPLARRAKLRRIAPDGTDLILCYAHATPLRDSDDVETAAVKANPPAIPAVSRANAWDTREDATWIDKL